MNSTRLPGKVLMEIEGKPMLSHVINQTISANLIDDVIIATSTNSSDEPIIAFCEKNNVKYFRGSEKNVLDRYFKCAQKFSCDPIIRVTADCPLVDPNIIDNILEKFERGNYDYVSTTITKQDSKWMDSTCNFPQGLAVEVAKFSTLNKAWENAKKPSELEHVFPYVQFHPELFNIGNLQNNEDFSYIRCTVDHPQDLDFVRKIYQKIPKNKPFVELNDILDIVRDDPKIVETNNMISFDEGTQKSYREDTEMGF